MTTSTVEETIGSSNSEQQQESSVESKKMNNAIGTLPPPPPAAANMETSFDLKQLHDALDIPIDEIDDTDLNYIEYINKLFPDESSISNIDSVIDKLNDKIKKIDDQLDNHYRDILEREKMHESMTTNLDKSLVDLMDSIEMTLKQSDESNSLVHNTLHDVMKYNEAKEGLENTSKILSDLLYLIEYSKKLKQLIDSQDFVQISTMLNVFESIYPTLSVLNKYEKVKNILADYNNLRSNLKDILLAKINDDVLKYSFNVSPDNYSAIFSCISSMDEEFQNGIISEILIHFEKELESILSSLLASIDSANFHHTVHDLNHWLGNYIDKILGFNSVGKMPINWHIVHKLCHNFVSQFEMIYEVAAKSDLFETSLPPTFLKIFEAIQALDETIISKMELARTPKSLVVNRIASKNLVAFNKLKFAINQEYADLSKKFNHQCLHDSPGYDGRKLDSDYKLLTITKPFFEFLRDNSSLLQFFPIKSQSLTNICQEFSYLFARLIDSFFAQNFTHCLDFAKLFHSYGNNSATCLSGGVKLPNFETADSGDGVAKSNRALLSLMFASNTQTNRLQFSKFNYSQVPKLLNSLSAKDQSYSPISPTINTANLPTSKLNHSTILQELAALLYVYEFAYDTIDSLESFLRMSSEIEYIETISFSSQIDFLIQCIDSTNHAISCIVISECSSMLDAFSTRAWYDESIGSRSDEGDTRQKSSKYVLNLISQLKLIASEVRDLLDSTRSHFITVCKLIVSHLSQIFLIIILNCHRGLSKYLQPSKLESAHIVVRSRLVCDLQIVSAFLVSLPVLNSSLSIEEVPKEFRLLATDQTNHLMAIIKFLFDEQGVSEATKVPNFDSLQLSTDYERILGEYSHRNFFQLSSLNFNSSLLDKKQLDEINSFQDGIEDTKDNMPHHILLKTILLWKFGPDIGNDRDICRSVFDIIDRKR